eukprot:4643193-Karenia_brevis.AAC.1
MHTPPLAACLATPVHTYDLTCTFAWHIQNGLFTRLVRCLDKITGVDALASAMLRPAALAATIHIEAAGDATSFVLAAL